MSALEFNVSVKSIKVLAVGVATFFVGIVWVYVDFRRQDRILATSTDWQFIPGPMPVTARILILSGALIFILEKVRANSLRRPAICTSPTRSG